MTETELRLEYAERTWSFELPDSIEQALEDDYVINSNLYTDDMIEYIQTLHIIMPNISPQQMVQSVHANKSV